MQIKAAEIADIIRRQIEGQETTIDLSEVGTVISVGDGTSYGAVDERTVRVQDINSLSGKVLRIGVTGHHDPDVLSRAVSEWPVDAVMMPVNPAEAVLGEGTPIYRSDLTAAEREALRVLDAEGPGLELRDGHLLPN